MDCYYCGAEATQECARCGALYCDDHGDALCSRCQDPELALPSYRVYRGSLLALLIGTVFAVWLLVKPPSTTDADGPLPSSLTNTSASQSAAKGPDGGAPAAGPPPDTAAASTPAGTGSPTAAVQEYTVVPGDTLLGIATKFVPPGKDASAFAGEISSLNGLGSSGSINVGQVLKIPQ